MTGFNKRIFEMLARLVVFAKAYPQFFAAATLAGQAVAEVEAAVQKLSAHDTSLVGGDAAVKVSAEERTRARAELRDYLETISRIANGLKLTQFSMPRGRSDRTLVSVGAMWAQHAEPLKQLFIDSGLTDFMERLTTLVDKVKRAIDEQTFSKGSRLAAAASIAQTRGDALAALERLDPIMNHLLRSDPPAFAVWERARRIERAPSASKPAAPEASPPEASPPTPPA